MSSAPRNFLGLPPEYSNPRKAPVLILPVPYEATTSYGGGTRRGPSAIIEASRTVELYDHWADDEPWMIGVATLDEVALSGAGPEEAMKDLRREYAKAAAPGKFVIMLGGEHTISNPPIAEWTARLKAKKQQLSVLQFDAHGDLRDEWEGTPYSHACVMRRICDDVNLVQVGIRAIAPEERELIRKRKKTITTIWAEEMEANEEWISRAVDALGPNVYITIDVDFFDPSLVPATGTPEPGGGEWYPALRLLERVFRERTVVAADVVELAPIPGMHAPDFVVAKLVYKLVAYYARHAQAGKRQAASGKRKT